MHLSFLDNFGTSCLLRKRILPWGVKSLTIGALLLTLNGCAAVRTTQHYLDDRCKTRAHLQLSLDTYLSNKNRRRKLSRVAVVPYSVPANLAARGNEMPGLGNSIAHNVHAYLLESTPSTITQIFNRQDWPGKKEEFYTGNHTAIDLARRAGFDLLLVGIVEPITESNYITARTKIIDLEKGVTIFYGTTETEVSPMIYKREPWWWVFSSYRPSQMRGNSLTRDLTECIVKGIKGSEVDDEEWPMG